VQLSSHNMLQKSSVDVENCAADDLEHICSVQINDVYMFMGRELEALDEIPAGNILGICTSTNVVVCWTRTVLKLLGIHV